MRLNILKIATVTPKLHVANPLANSEEIIKELKKVKADIVVFPELALTGYTAGDHLFDGGVLDGSLVGLKKIVELGYPGVVIVGMPLSIGGTIFNLAVVVNNGMIIGAVPKYHLSSFELQNESRYFTSGNDLIFKYINIFDFEVPFGNILFTDQETKITFGIEIGSDMYVPITKGAIMSTHGANMIINLAASFDYVNKPKERLNIVKEHSRKNVGAYIYTSSGITESSSYGVFSGHNIVSVCGEVINEQQNKQLTTSTMVTDVDFGRVNMARLKSENIKKTVFTIKEEFHIVEVFFPYEVVNGFTTPFSRTPLLPEDTTKVFNEIRDIQHFALTKRLDALLYPKVVLGLSGGLDSSYTLLLLVDSFKRLGKDLKDIIAVFMPGLHTTEISKDYAYGLAKEFKVTFMDIDITKETNIQFEMIEQDTEKFDATYENVQARIRTQTLMNIANKNNAIVIGTNNLSEIALGFMTYNADMMSMYAINSGMPKTLLARQFNNYKKIFPKQSELIDNILNRPYSPELLAEQITEDIVGTYEINDFLIYRRLVCGDSPMKLEFLLKEIFDLNKEETEHYINNFYGRFHLSQFKRQVIPDGPQIIDFSLSSKTGYLAGSDF